MKKTIVTKPETRVLLVDSHHIVRKGIRREIESEPDILVVGETNNGYEAIELSGKLKADVVILDVQLAELNGVKVTQYLNENTRRVTPFVLVFSSYSDKQYVWSFLAAGAKGYLLKSEPIMHLLTGIRRVVAGQTILSQTVQNNLVGLIPYLNQELSNGELKIVQLLAHGMTNREIAQILHISESTVKAHLNNMYRKIPWIRNRAEAISWAWINRIVTNSE